MRSLFPFSSLFASTLTLSTLIALSASHWLLIWMSLEMNLMSFIPLMSMSKTQQETEAAIKYFLAQAMGSALFLLSLLLMSSPIPSLTPFLPYLLLTMSLLLKLGAAPLHFWFPNVMASLSWIPCLILTTWQKLIPLILLMALTTANSPIFIHLASASSAIIGGLGGLNQSFLRPLLAYSSIGHIGWIMALSTLTASFSILYLIIYILTITPLIMILHSLHLSSLRQLLNLSSNSPFSTFATLALMMSLGGLPPLMGFLPKWLALESFSTAPFLGLLAASLILGSLMNLYYYLNICFSMTLTSNSSIQSYFFTSIPQWTSMLILPSSATLMLAPVIVIMFS
nr:NADH dehydrogenase subunit 2 [Chloeia sp. r EEE-2022]